MHICDIVRDKVAKIGLFKSLAAFEKLCKNTGLDLGNIVYLDTTSDKPEDDVKECYSIYAAKGLEFPEVFVYANGMTKNQKVVACTRAMGGLYYYE
jgi:ATP-dependent exoDNAse (exonuclease V) beta subunit